MEDDFVFIFNDVESTFRDKPKETIMEKRKYEQEVSECHKWLSLIKPVVGINITFLSNK